MFFNSVLTLISHQHNQFLQAGDADYLTFGGHKLYEDDYFRSLEWHGIWKDSEVQGRNRMCGGAGGKGKKKKNSSPSSKQFEATEAAAATSSSSSSSSSSAKEDTLVATLTTPCPLSYEQLKDATANTASLDANWLCRKCSRLAADHPSGTCSPFSLSRLFRSLSLFLYPIPTQTLDHHHEE
jgi:hypothetical protein